MAVVTAKREGGRKDDGCVHCGNGELTLSLRSLGSDAVRRQEWAGSNLLPMARTAKHRRRLLRGIASTFLMRKDQGRQISLRGRLGEAGAILGHMSASNPCCSNSPASGSNELPVYWFCMEQ